MSHFEITVKDLLHILTRMRIAGWMMDDWNGTGQPPMFATSPDGRQLKLILAMADWKAHDRGPDAYRGFGKVTEVQ